MTKLLFFSFRLIYATAQPSDATMTAVLSAFMSFLLERVGAVFGGPPEQLVISWSEFELHASHRLCKPC